jgi:flagellar FliL protein
LWIGIAAAAGICALAATATAAYVMMASPPVKTAQAATRLPEKPIFVTLEPLTVNLQVEGRGQFLHIGVALKVRDEKAGAQIVEFMPELRGRLVLLLSNRQPESLLSTEDKTRLAEEIRTALNLPLTPGLPPQGITSVSFNTFVVQ